MEESDPYYQRGVAGVEHRDIDASGDDHPFGSEPKPFKADLQPLIREFADDLYETWEETIREYLANAETACLKVSDYVDASASSPFDSMIVGDSYQPTILVTWDKREQKVIIEDNGIGMTASEVDEVFRYMGRSSARDMGGRVGEFGIGSLSFVKFIGEDNMMVMTSHSRLNDDNASYLITLAGIEPVRGEMPADTYGTRFELDQKERDMDVRSAVRRYAEFMRVPILYKELDEDGEEVFNEDWGGKRLYDNYSAGKYCDRLHKPGLFDAFMCESADDETILVSVEIDRDHSSHISYPIYPTDVRILDESGAVAFSENGNVGLTPISDNRYDEMLLTAREPYITESYLSSDDTVGYIAGDEYDVDYIVDASVLSGNTPLPKASYATVDEFGGEELSTMSVSVLRGPHSGKTIVPDGEWENMAEGRAEHFVRKSSLGEADICLPQPTTDRSSLQDADDFWETLYTTFNERYSEEVEEWRDVLRSESVAEAVENASKKTVADIRGY